MNQEPDALERAVEVLRAAGIAEVGSYRSTLAGMAKYRWEARHLENAARMLVQRAELRGEVSGLALDH